LIESVNVLEDDIFIILSWKNRLLDDIGDGVEYKIVRQLAQLEPVILRLESLLLNVDPILFLDVRINQVLSNPFFFT
jgi:hypothetical protein